MLHNTFEKQICLKPNVLNDRVYSRKNNQFYQIIPVYGDQVLFDNFMDQSHECFLNQVADSLYHIHGQNIANLTIVFPNRRAGLFFTEYLNRLITGPTFSPEIITIQELFSNISKLQNADQLQLIFHLFKIYKNLSGSKETFDEFYLWGEMLLHDFDQVDKYLVDAELLFTNVTDLKEIDEQFNDWNEERKEEIKHFWKSMTSGDQKHDQKEFVRLWQVLYPI